MLELLSWLFLILFFVTPIVVVIWLCVKKNPSACECLGWCLIAWLASHLFFYLSLQFIEWEFQMELSVYDLNGDGIFDESEDTPQMRRAMANLTNDTGRGLAMGGSRIIAAIYTAPWFLFVGGIHLATRWNNKILSPKKKVNR